MRRAVGILLLATMIAACDAAEETPQSAPTSTVDLTISMFEWGFGPSVVPIDAGSSTVRLHVRNDGSVLHEWAVVATPIQREIEFSRSDVLTSVRLEPGAVSTLEFVAPAAGSYQIICPISGHFSQGMKGSLIVSP